MSRLSPGALAGLDQEHAFLRQGVDNFVDDLTGLLANAEAQGVSDAEVLVFLATMFLASDTFDRVKLAALYATACLRLAREGAR